MQIQITIDTNAAPSDADKAILLALAGVPTATAEPVAVATVKPAPAAPAEPETKEEPPAAPKRRTRRAVAPKAPEPVEEPQEDDQDSDEDDASLLGTDPEEDIDALKKQALQAAQKMLGGGKAAAVRAALATAGAEKVTALNTVDQLKAFIGALEG